MSKTGLSILLGFVIGALTVSIVLADDAEPKQDEPEWCFRQQFESDDDFEAFKDTEPGEEFKHVFIKINGKKIQIFTKCRATPLPHRYSM